MLNELFEACEDVYKRSTGFVFRYLLMELEMWKWRPPPERQMETITKDQPISLRYEPWNISGDPNTKEINEKDFKSWYEKMLDTIQGYPSLSCMNSHASSILAPPMRTLT